MLLETLRQQPNVQTLTALRGAWRRHPRYQGCLGHWLTYEGGGSTVYDLSGRNHQGTLTNMDPATDWVTTEYGAALAFDGSDDYLDIPFTDVSTFPFTMMLWVNVPLSAVSTETCMSLGSPSVSNRNHSLNRRGSGVTQIHARWSSPSTTAQGGANIEGQGWHHLSGVWRSATDRELYLNGVSEATSTVSRTVDSNASNIYLAQQVGSVTNYNACVGTFTDARIYNRILSEDELRSFVHTPYLEFDWAATRRVAWFFVGASPAAGTTDGVGSSAGSAVVSGTGESIAEATAASSGTGVAAGVGVSTSAAAGSSAGVGTVSGVGASIHEASGSSAGVATATGIGTSFSAASGSSAGVATVSGIGASITASTAAAAGVATVSGIAATPSGVGSSAGVATVTGVGASTAASTAAAAGVATTAAISGSDIGIGTAAGVATVTGVGTGVTAAAAASAGSGVATGVGLALHAGSGASAGVGSAAAVTLSIFEGSAAALGAAAVAGIGRSTAAGLGQAAGLAVALSIGSDGSKPPTELAAQLDSVAVLTATLDLIPVLEATVDSPGG